MLRSTIFRKCAIESCPYRATFDSIYCEEHLKKYNEKKKKKGPIFPPIKRYKKIKSPNKWDVQKLEIKRE